MKLRNKVFVGLSVIVFFLPMIIQLFGIDMSIEAMTGITFIPLLLILFTAMVINLGGKK